MKVIWIMSESAEGFNGVYPYILSLYLYIYPYIL